MLGSSITWDKEAPGGSLAHLLPQGLALKAGTPILARLQHKDEQVRFYSLLFRRGASCGQGGTPASVSPWLCVCTCVPGGP